MDFFLGLITAATLLLQPLKTPSAPVDSWVYPGAVQVEKNVYQSIRDPAVITEWYKNKINRAGMNVTSFVVTSTNKNILNKLAGANDKLKVDIEINRNAGESTTKITLGNL